MGHRWAEKKGWDSNPRPSDFDHRVFLGPRVGPYSFLGLTLRGDNLGIYLALQLTLLNYLDHSSISARIISSVPHSSSLSGRSRSLIHHFKRSRRFDWISFTARLRSDRDRLNGQLFRTTEAIIDSTQQHRVKPGF